MNIGEWFASMWNKFIAAFGNFIKEVFNQEIKILIGEFKDFAIKVVTDLSKVDLENEMKRAEAFKAIKEEAIKRGKTLSDNMTNLLIEMAVARLKNLTPTA